MTMMYGWMDGYHGMGWGGGLGMLLFWVIVILGGIFLVRFVLDRRRAPRCREAALPRWKPRWTF
ncbi:MAG: hypothetical protein P1P84_00985 [Deferrisomatales bacterium]|nr:hypothetical protein [Deferrisomatales bacterium]